MATVRTKIVIQFVVNNLTIVSNFALAIILARLLTPTDIGIFSMSAILISIAHVFRDFGVASYLKREKELTEQKIRTALGVLLITSWLASVLLFASAPLWAAFLREPRVAEVIRVLALGFIFIPFGAIPSAILTRRMEVRRTSMVVGVSNIVHFAVCLFLAYNGFSYMTMAWANLIDILVCGLGYRWALGERLPRMPSFKGWGRIAHFGFGNVVPSLLQSADAAIPDIALGRLSTPAAVGLYSRANSTVNMIGTALNPTIQYFALPYLAQVHHTNGRIDQEYLRATSIINSLTIPVLVSISILSPELILFLFGPQWVLSASAMPWLCLAYGLNCLFTITAPAVTSIGKPYAAIWPLFILLVLKVAFAFVFFDGTLSNFAMGMALSQFLSIPLFLVINKIYLKVSVKAWLADVIRLALLAGACGVIGMMLKVGLPEGTPVVVVLVVCGCGTILTSLISFRVIKLPILHEFERIPIVKKLMQMGMLR